MLKEEGQIGFIIFEVQKNHDNKTTATFETKVLRRMIGPKRNAQG